jgi:hypothetical protein
MAGLAYLLYGEKLFLVYMDGLDLTAIEPDRMALLFDGTIGSLDLLIRKIYALDDGMHLWKTIWGLVNRKACALDQRRVSFRVRVIHRQVVLYTHARVCRMAELQRECRAHLCEDYGLVITPQLGVWI